MISPVWKGVDCPVTQPYGCTDVTVEPVDPACPAGHFHTGIDVGMAVGTPLFAARGGTVINITYGLFAIQGDGWTDWYVHVDRAADNMRLFQPVATGELCCYSGDKAPAGGALTGPHLHFEVQTGQLNTVDSSLNPVPVLTGGNMPLLFRVLPSPDVYLINDFKRHITAFEELQAWQRTGAVVQDVAQSTLDSIPAAPTSGGTEPTSVTGTFTGTFK